MKMKIFLIGMPVLTLALACLFASRVDKEGFVKKELFSILSAPVRKALNADARKQEVLARAQKMIQAGNQFQNADELEAKIDEIDQILENANAFEKMNTDELDDQTRIEFMSLMETKQKLLSIVIDREVKVSSDLLAGSK